MQVHDKKVQKEIQEREQKRLEKLNQKKREQELKDLFRTADGPKKEDEAPKTEEENKEEGDAFDQIEEEIKDEAELTIEEIVEKERAKIIEGTPVTWESFSKWKQFKVEQQRKEQERQYKLQMALYERSGHGLSGRELFKLNEALFVDDEEADDTVYEIPEDAIDEDLFLEGDEEEGEENTIDEDIDEEYEPTTWKERQTPKELLVAFLQTKKYPDAKFEKLPKLTPQEAGERISVIIEKPVKKEFLPVKAYPNKKIAEHNTALRAYRWLQKYEEQQEKKASEQTQ